MEWTDSVNDAIAYLERRLDGSAAGSGAAGSGAVDYGEAARAACCSLQQLQRLFLFVTGMTLSEYVRQRRMTLAADELLRGNGKVIDLALQFGYDSPEAFTRAFQNFHGYPPSVTRKFGVRKRFDRLSVQVNLRGGQRTMSTDQKILEHVRPVGWALTSANPFVGAVTACMDALGEGCDFRLAGMLSGVGFAYTWFPGATNDANLVDDAMIQRTFDALGCRVRIYRDGDTRGTPPSRDKGFYAEQIVKSIDRGYPVLGFGFTHGYPYACAVLGYADGGETLYLRSYWAEDAETDPRTGYQRTARWYERCRGIAVIEEKQAPALTGRALLRHCLRAAVELAEQKTLSFYDLTLPCGLATYDTMAAVLEDHEFWTGRDEAFFQEMNRSYSCVGLLLADHYRNWIAARWLKEYGDFSEAGRLIRQGCEFYHLLGWLVGERIGESRDFVKNPSDLADAEVRGQQIPFLRILRHLDGAAADCFSRALALL